MEPLVKVINLTKHFGGVKAVDNVSFDVNEGEILGLIGPNGSGKSTIVNLLNGVFPVTAGQVLLGHRDITHYEPYQRARIGLSRTFQIVKPLRSLTVQENVMVASMFSKLDDSIVKELISTLHFTQVNSVSTGTDELLERVGLFSKRHFYADDLTLPDRKRLELARVLMMKPKILLLDEVMAGLNHNEVTEIMDLIREINRTGVAIVVIEHIMKAIMGLADRIIVLHHGRLIASGTPNEICNNEDVIVAYLGEKYKLNICSN